MQHEVSNGGEYWQKERPTPPISRSKNFLESKSRIWKKKKKQEKNATRWIAVKHTERKIYYTLK